MGIEVKSGLKKNEASYCYSCSGRWSTQITIVKELLHYSDAVQLAEVSSGHCRHVLRSIVHSSEVSGILVSLEMFILTIELEGEGEGEGEEEPYHHHSF